MNNAPRGHGGLDGFCQALKLVGISYKLIDLDAGYLSDEEKWDWVDLRAISFEHDGIDYIVKEFVQDPRDFWEIRLLLESVEVRRGRHLLY